MTCMGVDPDEVVYADGGCPLCPSLLDIILTAVVHDIILPHKIDFL